MSIDPQASAHLSPEDQPQPPLQPQQSPHVSSHRAEALAERLRRAGCVFADDEAALLLAEESSPPGLEAMVLRRIAGEPLGRVLGWVEFAGLRLAVAPDVFVPRRRSELLVAAALPLLPTRARVVELCCGIGAVSAALRDARPDLRLHACDIDPAAVAVARQNLEPRGATVSAGDLFAAVSSRLRRRVDLVIANAPYVPSVDIELMPPEARDWEPRVSLDGGPDGLDLHRRIAAASVPWLALGGHLILETSEKQAEAGIRILASAGFRAHAVHDDDLDGTALIGILER